MSEEMVSGTLFFSITEPGRTVRSPGGANAVAQFGEEMVSGTCEEICFEKRRVEMIVAQMVRLSAW